MASISKISPKLNLVIPVEARTGTVYVHAAPISRDVFERYYLVLSKTFAKIYAEGLGFAAGPRVALLLLRDVAREMGESVAADVENGLIAEIRRLTNVYAGGETIPFQEIVDRGVLDGDDLSEVENALAFFTVASSMHLREELPSILEGASKLWGGRVESSDFTAFVASLKTSTAPGTTSPGAGTTTAKPSSIPS